MRLRLALLTVMALGALPGTALALPPTDPLPAVVSLGDSLASGEGAGDYLDEGPCHRSRNAQLAVAGLPGTSYQILACSGAETKEVLDTAQGTEPPQLEQLRAFGSGYEIKLVLITVGANDLGFTGIVADCAVTFATSDKNCKDEWGPKLEPLLAELTPRLVKVVSEVRKGWPGARVVLQSYPSPIPVENRFSSRLGRALHGCPFSDEDAAWASDTFVPALSGAIRTAARDTAVEFLDLTRAMAGREVCAAGITKEQEWTHGIKLNLKEDGTPEGVISRESLHPNKLGHAALGACLAGFHAQHGNGLCTREGETLKFHPVPFE